MRNSKKVYELLNHIDVELESYDKEELGEIEKQHFKRNFKRELTPRFNFKRLGYVVATLVIAIGLLGQTGIGKTVYAAAQSKAWDISYSIEKALGTKRDLQPYAKVVDKIVEVNGVTVKLNGVIIDKDELIFTTVVEIGEVVEGLRFDYNIFIDGRPLRNYGATGSSGKIDDDETVFYEIYAVDAKGIDLKRDLDIKIVLKDLNYITDTLEEGKIKGKWEFEFTANGGELMADSHAFALDYSFEIGDQKYFLQEYRYNPVNQKIFGKVKKGRLEDSYVVDLEGYDNLGNEVIFYLASVSGEDLEFKYSNILADLSDDIVYMTLKPYAAKLPKESGKMSSDYEQVGEEFTIFLKDQT